MTVYKSQSRRVASTYRSVFSHVTSGINSSLEDTAYVDGSTHAFVTRGQVIQEALQFAHTLRNGLSALAGQNLNEGDILLVFTPNSLLSPSVLLGALAAGVCAACSGASQTVKELAHQISITKPKHFAVHPSIHVILVDALGLMGYTEDEMKRRIILLARDEDIPSDLAAQDWVTYSKMIAHENEWVPVKFDGERAHNTAAVFYSSGTTSLPKALETTHANIIAQLDILVDWNGLKPSDGSAISPFPFFHVGGYITGVLYPLLVGVPFVFIPKFEFLPFLVNIERYKSTLASIPPSLLPSFATHPAILTVNLTSLRTLISGAAPVGETLLKTVHERLKNLTAPDFSVGQAYGLSEMTASSHITPSGRGQHSDISSIGLLRAGLEARLVDDDEEDVAPGEAGELWLRGPTIMKGYLGAKEATEEAINLEGWFKSGDIARRDDEGWYYIVDRKKELIKYNGFQVPPAELENTLNSHPLVTDSVVIGVLSPDGSTELPRAYIVPSDPALLNDPEFPSMIQTWIKGKVAYYKELRGGVRLIASIPRSAAGKVSRRELRDLAKKEIESDMSDMP